MIWPLNPLWLCSVGLYNNNFVCAVLALPVRNIGLQMHLFNSLSTRVNTDTKLLIRMVCFKVSHKTSAFI